MEFTKGKYRCRNGAVVEVIDRFHGFYLRGRNIEGYPESHSTYGPYWLVPGTKYGMYEADLAKFEKYEKGSKGPIPNPDFDLMEKI